MLVEILAADTEVKNGVADELAGAVVSGLATAVDFEDGRGQGIRVLEGGLVAAAADGVDWLVFEEEEGFGLFLGEDRFDGLLLEGEGFLVGLQVVELADLHGRSGQG